MRREKTISFLIAVILSFCIGFGSVACIVTGFSLNQTDGSVDTNYYTVGVDLWGILLFCAVFSVAAVAFFSLRRGGWILLGILALLLGYLWRMEILEVSLEAVLYRLTYVYNRAYRWGVASWTDAYSPDVSPDLGACVLAGIPVLLTAWTVYRRKNAMPAVLSGCLMLGACFVVTDTVPAVWCLFLLLSGLILLILTNTVRRQHAVDGNRLTALMLVPVLLFMSLMFGLVPKEGFEPNTDSIQQMFQDWLKKLSFAQSYTGSGTGVMDLTAVGPKTELYYAVMDVTAPKSGTLYLRGQALDIYTGKAWDISESAAQKDGGWPTQGIGLVGTVTISARRGLAFKYFPYYPSGEHWPGNSGLKDGGVANPYRQRDYSFAQMEIKGGTGAFLASNQSEQCLELPYNTKIRAAEHLQKIGYLAGKPEREIAALVGDYVSNIARYDLNTERMPTNESDFAMWFLQDADSGYCVHYATAATVLLRAAGVPARYVSGYAVRAEAGTRMTVTENRAHAWVEYFVPDAGWVVLDPTPSSWYTGDDDTTDPTVTTEPEPEVTEPSTEPGPDPTEPVTTPTEPSLDPTQPSGGDGDGTVSVKVDLSWLWQILKWLGGLLGICLVIGGQYFVRLRIRKNRMHTGHPNRRALARWVAVIRMSRILKEKPPQELYELAEKAKFSQHTLTAGERMEFDRYLNYANEELNKKPLLKRWLIRLVWAV